jgi:GT2 family glycosyltransferase
MCQFKGDGEMESPFVSIIVLNYNGGDFLVEAISSVLKSNYSNFEVILADNGSTDGSVLRVKMLFKDSRLRIIENRENLQYAAGNNLAVAKARGDYIALLNNDVSVSSNWLRPMVDCLLSDSQIGACQSKLLQYFDRRLFDSAGGFMTANGVGGNRGFDEVDNGQYDECEPIFVAKGAAMLIRKDLFRKIGGFDPFYVALYEDVDLSWRIYLAGFKIIYTPQSVVYHVGRASSKKNPSKETFLSVRNSLLTLIKNYDPQNFMKSIIPSTLIRLFLIPMQLASISRTKIDLHHPSLVSSPLDIIKAFASLIVNLRVILTNRLMVQKYIRKVSDEEALTQMWRVKGEIGLIARWSLYYHCSLSYSSFLEKYKTIN